MKRYEKEIIHDICELVKYPSVYEKSEKYMFGKSIDECLDEALRIMQGLGFKTFKAEDGAYGYAEIGEGEMFAVLGHLDVVNARMQDGWQCDPFTPTVKDGYIIGRGTQDDKGPVIVAAYALKSLIDDGFTLKNRVRFILGLDEETLWRSIEEYKKREQAPVMGFTPDSAFPLTYAEKGLLQVLLKSAEKPVQSYKGGDSFNAVPSYAECKNNEKIKLECDKLNIEYEIKDDTITVKGQTAHAKNPWKGKNACLYLLQALHSAGDNTDAVKFANEVLYNKFRFEGFSDNSFIDFSGDATVNLGKVQAGENGTEFCVDFRLPVTADKTEIFNIIKQKAKEYGFEAEEYSWLDPIHVPLESEFIQNLLAAYWTATGDANAKAYISAGATYARAFDNCVAFGANFPNSPTSEHQPNEKVLIEDLLKAGEVYKIAFKKCVVNIK